MSDTTSIDAAAAAVNALLAKIELSNARVVQAQDTGTADNYVFAPTPAIASYGADLLLLVDIATPNATTTPDGNVSGLGKLLITASDGTPVKVGAVAGKCMFGLSSAAGGGYTLRLMFAVPAGLQSSTNGASLGSASGGTATALTTTLTPVPASAVAGLRIKLPITTTNGVPANGAYTTLQFNTAAGNVTAPIVLNQTGNPLAGNEMPGGVGYEAELEYDGNGDLRLINPLAPTVPNSNNNAILSLANALSLGNAQNTQLPVAGTPTFGTVSNGVFTATKAGLYSASFNFAGTTSFPGADSFLSVATIYKNGVAIPGASNTDTGYGGGGNFGTSVGAAISGVYLNAGDTLSFWAYMGNPAGGISAVTVNTATVTLAKVA